MASIASRVSCSQSARLFETGVRGSASDGSGRPGLFDSVIQSAWSFMVALRSRGLGSVWTTMFLGQADAVAELLELPDDVAFFLATQIQSNVRELEGALLRLSAFARF